jgi:hypothetical protein
LDNPQLGLIERRALARWRRAIAPYAHEDEEVLDFDTGRDGLDGAPLDLAVTQRVLYVLLKRARWIRRIPYEEIMSDPTWKPGIGESKLSLMPSPQHSGSQLPLFVRIRDPQGLGDYLVSRVRALIQFERQVAYVGDTGATYRFQPWREGEGPIWEVSDPAVGT